jgi:hypothetical protein
VDRLGWPEGEPVRAHVCCWLNSGNAGLKQRLAGFDPLET